MSASPVSLASPATIALDIPCVGGWDGERCAARVHPTRGGARCEAHTPVDLTHLAPAPAEVLREQPRTRGRFGAQLSADAIADALRRVGNYARAAALLGVTRQAISDRVRNDPTILDRVAGGGQ